MIFDNTPLYIVPEGIETSWASPENPGAEKGRGGREGNGRKGSAFFPLKAGENRILAQENDTCGIVRRIWATISDRSILMLRGLRLDFYWDGCEKPAVSSPFGDFFGTGLGYATAYQSALFTNPEGRSFVCYIPMPFKKGMKITVTNETDTDLAMFYYDIDYTRGDQLGPEALYLHAHYRREAPTVIQKDYEILPLVHGKGRYVGCNIGVIANRELYFTSWWGEGEVKIYLDGDKEYPSLCGTGTEDFIGTGWGQGRFDHLYQGCHVADRERYHYCFYRYHLPDPVYFKSDIRVTIQQLGCWSLDLRPLFHYHDSSIYSTKMERLDFSKASNQATYGFFERQDDWSSCAYLYLDQPENNLPVIDPVNKRIY